LDNGVLQNRADLSADNPANEQLARYLLGEMSDEEQTQFEIRYFADPQLLAELCAWRDKLIDDYVSDGLSPALRLRFEAAIENSWAMNERIRFAESLQETIDARGAATTTDGVSGSLRVFLSNYRRTIVAAVLLLIILTAVWLFIVSRH